VEGREAPGAYRWHEVHDPAEAAWPLVHTLPLTVSAFLLAPPKGARMRQRSNKSSSNKQQPTWPRIYQSQTSLLYSRRSQICLNLHQRLRGRSTVSCSHPLLGKRWTEPTMNPLRGNFKLSNFQTPKMSESPPKTQGEEHGVVQSPIVGEHMDGTNAQYPEGYGQNVKEHDRRLTASGTLSSDSLRKRLRHLCYLLIELTIRAWIHDEDNKRRTLHRSDNTAILAMSERLESRAEQRSLG
jgi:hypothetical protein